MQSYIGLDVSLKQTAVCVVTTYRLARLEPRTSCSAQVRTP